MIKKIELLAPAGNIEKLKTAIYFGADAVYLAVFCLKKEAEKTEEALRAGGFARPSQISNQIPVKKCMLRSISLRITQILVLCLT